MKQKPRWTLEMFTAGLAVLCLLLAAAVLAAQPAVWPVLLGLVVLWALGFVVFRHHLRRWVARWMCGGKFEKSKLRFSLEPLSEPAALLSGNSILWYNDQFRARLLGGGDLLISRVKRSCRDWNCSSAARRRGAAEFLGGCIGGTQSLPCRAAPRA